MGTYSNKFFKLILFLFLFLVDVGPVLTGASWELFAPAPLDFNFGIVSPTYAKIELLSLYSGFTKVPSSFFNCTRIRPRFMVSYFIISLGKTFPTSYSTLKPAATRTSRISLQVGFSTACLIGTLRPSEIVFLEF